MRDPRAVLCDHRRPRSAAGRRQRRLASRPCVLGGARLQGKHGKRQSQRRSEDHSGNDCPFFHHNLQSGPMEAPAVLRATHPTASQFRCCYLLLWARPIRPKGQTWRAETSRFHRPVANNGRTHDGIHFAHPLSTDIGDLPYSRRLPARGAPPGLRPSQLKAEPAPTLLLAPLWASGLSRTPTAATASRSRIAG